VDLPQLVQDEIPWPGHKRWWVCDAPWAKAIGKRRNLFLGTPDKGETA